MKELTSKQGGRYLFFEDLSDIQHSALSSAEALYFGKGDCVISGCELRGTTLSAGYVFLDGKIREVPETKNVTAPVYIVPRNTTEQGMYLDSAALQDTAVDYGVSVTNNPGSGSYLLVSGSSMSPRFMDLLLDGASSSGSLSIGSMSIKYSLEIGSQAIFVSDSKLVFSGGIHAGPSSFVDIESDYISSRYIMITEGDDELGINISGISVNGNIAIGFEDSALHAYGSVIADSIQLDNTTIGKTGITYIDHEMLSWNGGDIRTEMPVHVAGVGRSTAITVQRETSRGASPTYQNIISESGVICYAPSTGEYPNNRAGLDMTNGNANLLIHGHSYKLAVSASGFLYDANNPDFVDPIAGEGGSGGSGGTDSMSVAQLNDVEFINFKKSSGGSTYTGQLGLNGSGMLSYDGNLQLGGSMMMTNSSTISGAGSIQVGKVYTGTINILDNDQYVQAKAGTTTIISYNNIRFSITQGSTSSSRIVKIVADKVTQTFVGGILVSVVTNTGQVLTGLTTPHPVEIVTQ